MNAQVSLAITLSNFGSLYDRLGERERALGFYQEALRLHEVAGSMGEISVILFNMALLHQEAGRLLEAASLLERAVAIDEQLNGPDAESTREALRRVRRSLAYHSPDEQVAAAAEEAAGSQQAEADDEP